MDRCVAGSGFETPPRPGGAVSPSGSMTIPARRSAGDLGLVRSRVGRPRRPVRIQNAPPAGAMCGGGPRPRDRLRPPEVNRHDHLGDRFRFGQRSVPNSHVEWACPRRSWGAVPASTPERRGLVVRPTCETAPAAQTHGADLPGVARPSPPRWSRPGVSAAPARPSLSGGTERWRRCRPGGGS